MLSYCFIMNSWFVDTGVTCEAFLWKLYGCALTFSPKTFPTENCSKNVTNSSALQNCILSHGTRKSTILEKRHSQIFLLSVLKWKVWGFPPSVHYCWEPFNCSFHGDISIFTWCCHGLLCGLTIYWNSRVRLTTDYFAKVKYTHIYSYLLILLCSLTDANRLTDKTQIFKAFYIKAQGLESMYKVKNR